MAVSKDLPGSHQAQVHSTSAEGFNTRELRSALGSFATGVTIITTRDRDGTPHGMTANSFSSVSLNPPLVLWSSSLYAQSLPAFQESPHFCVNILAYDQIELSNKFAKQADEVPTRGFGSIEINCRKRVGHDLVEELIHRSCQRDVHGLILRPLRYLSKIASNPPGLDPC